MKKRIISALTIAAYIMSAAFAAPEVYANSVLVKTSGTADYSFSIPADMSIPYKAQNVYLGAVKPTKLLLEADKKIVVSVDSKNGFALERADGKSKIPYKISINGDNSYDYKDTEKELSVYIDLNNSSWAAALSGEHSDILTFTFNYQNK